MYTSFLFYVSLLKSECPNWKYSNDCSKTCQCDKKTSKGCDPITGDCLCHDKYGGADCSCHTSMISTCKSPYSTCEYDRCKCNQGLFNVSTSCSGKFCIDLYMMILITTNIKRYLLELSVIFFRVSFVHHRNINTFFTMLTLLSYKIYD